MSLPQSNRLWVLQKTARLHFQLLGHVMGVLTQRQNHSPECFLTSLISSLVQHVSCHRPGLVRKQLINENHAHSKTVYARSQEEVYIHKWRSRRFAISSAK